MLPSLAVLGEHDGDGSPVSREAALDHSAEQEVLLLAVVGGVGEVAEESGEAGDLRPLDG